MKFVVNVTRNGEVCGKGEWPRSPGDIYLLLKIQAEGLGVDDPSGFQFRPSEFLNCESL